MSPERINGVLEVLKGYFKGISRVFQESFKKDFMVFSRGQGLGMFQGHITNVVPRVSQVRFQKGCFKVF